MPPFSTVNNANRAVAFPPPYGSASANVGNPAITRPGVQPGPRGGVSVNASSRTPNVDAPTQLRDVKSLVDNLLSTAARRGVAGIGVSMEKALLEMVPRPKAFRTGHVKYKAFNLLPAAKAYDASFARLGKIPAHAFRTTSPRADEAFAALEAFVTAANDFSDALKKFDMHMQGSNAAVQTLFEATQFRIGEALNLTGRILGERRPKGNALDGLQDVASQMHGHIVHSDIATQADGLFTAIHLLERRRNDLPVAAFQERARSLATQANTLLLKVQNITDRVNPNNPNVTLKADTLLRDALAGHLARAEKQLNRLANCNPRAEILAAFDDIAPEPVDTSAFKALKRRKIGTLNLIIDKIDANRARFKTDREALRRDIAEGKRFGANEITDRAFALISLPRLLRGLLQETIVLNERASKYADVPMRLDLAKQQFLNDVARLMRNAGFEPGDIVAARNDLLRFALSSGFSRDLLQTCMEELDHPLISSSESLVRTQFNALQDMARIAGADQSLHDEYVLAAFDHDVSVATLLEASLRNIPTDQLEMRVGDETMEPSKTLGQGAANTVSLCTYRDADGEPLQLVFKPESGARFGLAHLRVNQLGYRDELRVMQLNLAATTAADAIGCGNSVARSSIGTHDGRLGLFMERAPGGTAYALKSRKHEEFQSILRAAKAKGTLRTIKANLMRELSNLEWADVLSGQADRHADNYLVDINPDTGAVKVTGIDNDAAFGTYKTGMQKIDVTNRYDTLPQPLKERCRETADGRRILDASALPDARDDRKFLGELRSVFGFNQMFKPTLIGRDVFEKLVLLNVDDYRDKMRAYMDEDAANAAAERLLDAQNHAKALMRAGCVVDDWQSNTVSDKLDEHEGGFNIHFFKKDGIRHANAIQHSLRRGFFMRDFAEIFNRLEDHA